MNKIAFFVIACSGLVGNVSTLGATTTVSHSHPRPTRADATPQPCSSNAPQTPAPQYFVGIANGQDVAGGDFATVTGGYGNAACERESSIGAGLSNLINPDGNTVGSFIGAGYSNVVSGTDDAIGAGSEHAVSGPRDFIGAGEGGGEIYYSSTDEASDAGIIAGDSDLVVAQSAFTGGGNDAEAESSNSAVVAGASNVVSYTGSENSIIGGGEYSGEYNRGTGANSAFIGGGADAISGTSSSIYLGGAYNEGANTTSLVAGSFNDVNAASSITATGFDNFAGAPGDFIGGGGSSFQEQCTNNNTSCANSYAYGDDAFIGSGELHVNRGPNGFIGSGYHNWIAVDPSKAPATGEGSDAGAEPQAATAIGGYANLIDDSGNYAVVSGGYLNTATAAYAVVAGGNSNIAAGSSSFSGGYHATSAHDGSFVWSDHASQSKQILDSAANEFLARASGGTTFITSEGSTSGGMGVSLPAGAGAWSMLSDRNAKTNIVALDDESVLAKLATMQISSWRYKTESGARHYGPMAQDFYAAFYAGEDDRHITSIDEAGVAFAAIEALQQRNVALRSKQHRLSSKIMAMRVWFERRLDALEARLQKARNYSKSEKRHARDST